MADLFKHKTQSQRRRATLCRNMTVCTAATIRFWFLKSIIVFFFLLAVPGESLRQLYTYQCDWVTEYTFYFLTFGYKLPTWPKNQIDLNDLRDLSDLNDLNNFWSQQFLTTSMTSTTPNCPKMSPNCPKMSPNCPKMSPNRPKMSPNCPKMSSNCPKMSPNGPKCPQIALKCPRIA